MSILRILNVKVVDSGNIDITFTSPLTTNLIASNILLISDTNGVPDSQTLTIKITNDIISLTCLPLSPLATYYITLQSLPSNPFQSVNGDARVSEDGVSNTYLITAPLSPENPVKNYLNSFLSGNIYDTENEENLVTKYINLLSVVMSRALYDINQVKNENYLGFDVVDEQHVRGVGAYDRLNEESAYDIVRVGLTPTGTSANTTFPFTVFPSYPVTLQKQSNVETLKINFIDLNGYFNINTLVLNLSNFPVTKINSILFTLNTATPNYTYNISTLGYQLKNSRYDQDYASTYDLINDNQVKLNEAILLDPLFSLNNILKIDVTYESKNLGIVVDPNSVQLYSTQSAVREVSPPIINIFNLSHAPITDASNNIPTTGGVSFINTNTTTGAPHPAFLYEIKFSLSSLPSIPGQYSIDYTNGKVYVYGADLNNDGTGPYPPLATYNYRLVYQNEIDYIYDQDLLDVVSLPNGSLRGYPGSVYFTYEQVLVPGVDYKAELHSESINERIGNKLNSLNVLRVANFPITDVFEIRNETSGEIYTLNRWDNDKIYFRYNNPPKISEQTNERASFNTIFNELLFVNTTLTNTSSLRIFKILLKNNNLVAASEDSIANAFNTSLSFANTSVFASEKWFDRSTTEQLNINRLLSIGQYMVDYVNGIVYCAVSSGQDFNLGSATYKNSNIIPQFPHLISVEDLYYRISVLENKNKIFNYTSFDDGTILPSSLEPSDELLLNNSSAAPYQLSSGSVGAFVNAVFVPGVTEQVKFVRSLYEYTDLVNSTNPFNFANACTSSNFNVSVGSISKQSYQSLQYDGYHYYVLINENIPYISSNITYSFTITRLIDSATLWNSSGTIVPGNPVKLILPGINGPTLGDQVTINYTISINNLSRVSIDYNKGDYFVDYTYLADEILVSYEYGDNVLDFRESLTVPASTGYYVSYRVGALRDALLKNFGTLVNVPELASVDLDFNRERYRDALNAALSSFIQGPTLTAIKNIGKTISHIEPEVIESAFINWSLGSSLLYPESITSTGTFSLLPAKYGNGVLVNDPSQKITFPVSSNLRLEDGTFETWIAPQWNGIDNDADLTFTILLNGVAIPANKVFVGASETHPTIINGKFTIDKSSNVSGMPNTNKDGVFIYYNKDISGNFNRWYVRVIDGYVSTTSSNYSFTITSNGNFYDAKSMVLPKPSNLTTFTGTNSLKFNITGGSFGIDEGVTFVSDLEHYLLDFGQDITTNRLSIFKDISGYINFRVFDNNKKGFYISYDASSWKAGDLHHVAASWKINTKNNRDEMHLFIDGLEVPNIIRYGQKLKPYLHEKFRTVDPEEIAGLSTRDILSSTDLSITSGSYLVSSSINFNSYNIFVGDTIYINEIGFSSSGYTISAVNGQVLTLNTAMPSTLSNGRFTINKTSFTVTSDIDVSLNIAVSTIHALVSASDLIGTSGLNTVSSSSVNFTTLGVLPGYLIRIDSITSPLVYTITQVSGQTLTITDNLSVNVSAGSFQIYSNTENEIPGVRATRPSYSISKDGYFNNILTISNSVYANDLILIRTLGLNHARVVKHNYIWSDGYENVLMTQMPPPISLDEASIKKFILIPTVINSTNSTLVGSTFTSNNLTTNQPTNITAGRTLTVKISGTNVDFTSPVLVSINGIHSSGTITETLSFNAYGSLDFINSFKSINYINVVVKVLNTAKAAVVVEVKEKYAITYSEFGAISPVIRYSYQMGGGYTLHQDGYNSVRDANFSFSALDINNYLYIQSPAPVAGFYLITGISFDRKSITISPTSVLQTNPIPSFTGGVYIVLNTNQYRSGLQNGYFTFEQSNSPGTPFLLNHGTYELDYSTYTKIAIEPHYKYAYIGSDFKGNNQLNGIINDLKIYSTTLTDTRVGETLTTTQNSITKDFNSLKPLKADNTTLMLVSFNSEPFANASYFYANSNKDKHHFQSSIVVNSNFGNSLSIIDKPIRLDNNNILDTRKQATIEFWVNPLFDTNNDPFERCYFDASGAIVEEVVSTNSSSLKLSSQASKIISVTVSVGDPSIDYFIGGKIEIDTQNAIQEEVVSSLSTVVSTSKYILQVISVKIVGDLTNKDYFNGGSIGPDQKTIYLGTALPSNTLQVIITYQTTESKKVAQNSQIIRLNKQLPYQNTKVLVKYLPLGLQGDRLSIFKDKTGYMNFVITASNIDYIVRAPAHWAKNTWHRVRASYKVNSGVGSDEMRLFLDGYEWTNVTYGSGLVFGTLPAIYGASLPGNFVNKDGYSVLKNISFKDPINELYIGTQYTGESPIFSLIDNFRISNTSRPIYAPYNESIDLNYSSNLSTVFPVTKDLYTTYLMDFDQNMVLNNDFAMLKNKKTGIFDFTVNILDSLDIVNSSIKVKETLEAIIKILKPANSRVFINYTA
jgi:hypothetical protein